MGDENVEMALTKFLVTASMSPLLVIHGEALLTVVRALYNIHLGSRSEVNQCMAKAALFQVRESLGYVVILLHRKASSHLKG